MVERPDHNLPVQLTSFVGRVRELDEIAELLTRDECHLLTLVGPGGIGKTRLALESASRVLSDSALDGVYFVTLQPLSSASALPGAVAEAVGLQFYAGIDPREQLADYFCSKSILLVLDNFEHLLDGAPFVTDLLLKSPDLKILATSRETLNLQEEWVFQVTRLNFPSLADSGTEPREQIEQFSAVRLFIACAQRARPDFSPEHDPHAILRICQLVEGMPLALEMAAAWLRRLPVAEIELQLKRGLDILESNARNVPARHRSIRAVFDYSWNLLTDSERDVFMKLSVFKGGFRKEAAQAVANAALNTLSALVDKSLLRLDNGGRYDLHELLRQYAEEKMLTLPAIGEQVRAAHCAYYMDYLAQRDDAVRIHASRAATDEIIMELKNVTLAWDQALTADDLELYWNPVVCVGLVFQYRCLFQEGAELFARIVEKARTKPPGEFLIIAIQILGWLTDLATQDHQAALALYEEGLSKGNELGLDYAPSIFLLRMSEVVVELGDYERGRYYAEACVERMRESIAEWAFTYPLAQLGKIHFLLRDYSKAKELFQEAIRWAQEYNATTGCADAQNYLGEVELAQENFQTAAQTFKNNLSYSKEAGYLKGIVLSLIGAGEAACGLGNYQESRLFLAEALRTAVLSHQVPFALQALTAVAALLSKTARIPHARSVLNFVINAPATLHETRKRAHALLLELQTQQAPDRSAGHADDHSYTMPGLKADSKLEAIAQFLLDNDLAAQLEPTQSTAQDIWSINTNMLSDREMEILRLMADGLSNREIAERLFLAVSTIKWYLGEIYSKINVSSRTQALVRARELKLIA